MQNRQNISDEEIIREIRNGNQKVLTLLYKRNKPILMQHIIKNNVDRDRGEDIIQDCLVIAWENILKPNFELSAKLDTYIFSIARNLWLKELRKTKNITQQDDFGYFEYLKDDNEIFDEDNQVKDIIQKALNQTGETCRLLLMYFYYDGFTMDKISELLGFNNADTAKAKKYQCKKKLEEIVKTHFRKEDLY